MPSHLLVEVPDTGPNDNEGREEDPLRLESTSIESADDGEEHDASFLSSFSKSVEISSVLRSRSKRRIFVGDLEATALHFEEEQENNSLMQQHTPKFVPPDLERNYTQSSILSTPGTSSHRFSDFSESLFNATNSLVGVGLLSLPFCMRLCGWLGIGLLVLTSAFTCYTAKLLGRIMSHTPRFVLVSLHLRLNRSISLRGMVTCDCCYRKENFASQN